MQQLQSTSFCWSIIPTMFSIKHSTEATLPSNHRVIKAPLHKHWYRHCWCSAKDLCSQEWKTEKHVFMDFIELVGWPYGDLWSTLSWLAEHSKQNCWLFVAFLQLSCWSDAKERMLRSHVPLKHGAKGGHWPALDFFRISELYRGSKYLPI